MGFLGESGRRSGDEIRRRGNRRISSRPLHLERCEERRLLAADGPVFVANPFQPGAWSFEALAEVGKERPHVPGQIIIARDAGSFRESALQASTHLDWSGKLGLTGQAAATTLLRHQTTEGSSLELIQVDFDPGLDLDRLMRRLKDDVDILWSSPNFSYSGTDPRDFVPSDPQYASQSHHAFMRNELAWDTTLGDPSVIIAVTDDGISLTHDDLVDNIWTNPLEVPDDGLDNDNNGYVDDVHGWDFIQNDNNPNPSVSDSHGTHVAGIAAGDTDNNKGIAGTAGNATIMPIKFYDGQNPTAWTSSVILAAMQYAVNNGAKIINTSYNIDWFAGDPTVAAAFQYIHDHGRLHFNSAGNGNLLNPVRQVFEQTLLVASTETGNSKSNYAQTGDVRSGSSNYGLGVDISAPGGSILSTVPGNNYLISSGTSMAAPNAAGAAALIWSANPTWTRDQVAAQLLATADNIDSLNPKYAGYLGAGRVNSHRALTETPAAPKVKGLHGLPQVRSAATPGISSFSLSFNQMMEATSVRDVANYELRAAGPDATFDTQDDLLLSLTNTNTNYYVGTNLLNFTIEGGPLGYGRYRLSLRDGGIQSYFGSPLDGDADGVAGGSYRHEFSITIKDFVPSNPGGSAASISSGNHGSFSAANEVDLLPIRAEAGEAYALVITPTSPALTVSATVPGNPLSFTAQGPGEILVVPPQTVSQTGDIQISLSGDLVGDYIVEVIKNASPASIANDANDDIDMSLLSTAGRGTVIGHSSGSPGAPYFQHANDNSKFVDISSTGTALTLNDDSTVTIHTTVGNSLFSAGSVRVGNNGGILRSTFGNVLSTNTVLPNAAFSNALFPYWDDLGATSGSVYWQEIAIEGHAALVVQWHERPRYVDGGDIGSATFQVQVFGSGPIAVRFAYRDVDFGDERFTGGLSATIGYQTNSTTAGLFSFNQAAVVDGDVIDILVSAPTIDVDEFGMDLTAFVGHQMDIVLDGVSGVSFATSVLELVDPNGQVIATGIQNPGGMSPVNADIAIQNVTIPHAGIFKVRASLNLGGDYTIVVTDEQAFAFKPTSLATPIAVDGLAGAIGSLTAAEVSFRRQNDIGKFVDISATGTSLNLQDDAEVSIVTTVGNKLFPAGKITVANNGGIIQGASRSLSSANAIIPNIEFVRSLLPYWDDLDDDTGNVYWQETTVEGIPALVVQWDRRPRYTNGGAVGSATFQVQVFQSGAVAARFAYADVTFGDPAYDNGRSATIGYQADAQYAATYGFNTASIQDGDFIDLYYADSDYFSIQLNAGQEVVFLTSLPFDNPANIPLNSLDPVLEVWESGGTQQKLATDANSMDGKNARISFLTPLTGEYIVRVGTEGGAGAYQLVVQPVVVGIDGDFDDDSIYGCSDIDALTMAIVSGGAVSTYDLNADQALTPADVLAWLAEAGQENLGPGRTYLVGDADLDGNVDGADFGLWNATKFTSIASWCSGDFDSNGVVDGADFGLWNANKFTSA